MRPILTDVFSFPQMREIGALYVDKTADVWRMVNDSCGRTFFLSRPRRFGKSLLLSTFKAFFQGRRDLFKGLKIDSLAPDPVRFYDGYFRNVMLAMLTVASVDGRAEQQTAAGRIDLVVNFPSCAYVFELKTHDGATTPEAVLDAAMEQTHTKNYAAAYARPDKTVTLVAMSFNRGTRQVSGYRAEPITA